MLDKLYLRRLQKDLATWVERGWVAEQHRAEILEHASGGATTSRAPFVTAIMGILLIGGGVIMFFAANWDGMTKLAKLIWLLGGMWAAYGIAFAFLSKREDLEQKMGQAMLGLGLILFGANIMLVSQAFHISDRAPHGILLWALGGLVGAWLMRSHVLAFFGIALATLWTGMEIGGFFGGLEPAFAPWPHAVHWPFPIVWAGFMWLTHINKWSGASRLGIIVMIWWLWMTFADLLQFGLFDSFYSTSDERYLFGYRLSFLLMANLFLLGRIAEHYPRLTLSAPTLRNTAIFVGLSFLYASTTRSAFNVSDLSYGIFGPIDPQVSTTTAATMTAIALAISALGLSWFESQKAEGPTVPGLPKLAQAGLVLAVIVSATLVPWNFEPDRMALVAYIGMNVLFLLAMAGMVQGGYVASNRMAVNLGLAFFTLWIVVLYFDTFFGLMDRSLFFVSVGVLLLGGGYALQRQRRKLMRRMDKESAS